jgi:hypothetical protein
MYWVLPKLASFQWGLLRKMPLSWVPAISRKIFIKGLQK